MREYWIVDPAEVIERRSGANLSREEDVADRLESDLLPGFALAVPELFE